MFWLFYIIGGIIGTSLLLRFTLPIAYTDVCDAWGVLETLRTVGYHLIRVLLLSCVVFFVSWIAVGFFILNYNELRE